MIRGDRRARPAWRLIVAHQAGGIALGLALAAAWHRDFAWWIALSGVAMLANCYALDGWDGIRRRLARTDGETLDESVADAIRRGRAP